MKRLTLFLGLALLLALAACGGETPQTAVPTGAVQTVEAVTLPAEGVPTAVGEEAPVEGAAAGGLTGVMWEWVSVLDPLGQTVVVDPARYTITFNDDGTANIVADCNNVVAEYASDGSSLNLILGAGTLMACPPDSQDQLFLNSLPRAGSYTVQDGELFIEMLADGGTIIFRQAGSAVGGEAPDAAGTSPTLLETWQWVETTTPTETISVADPARYAITFEAEGAAGIVADCNVGNATYTADETGAMDIILGITTLAFCENSQDQQFRAGLEAATTYSFEGTALLLGLPDGGVMRFQSAPGETTEGAAAPTLAGVTWQWVDTTTATETVAAADPARYTIYFDQDGTAAVKADCNSVTATYTSDEAGALSVILGASTLMACPPDTQDQVFTSHLAGATGYLFEDSTLVLTLADGGAMRFQAEGAVESMPPAEAPALTGTIWQWVATQGPETAMGVADPTRYTVTFNEDGTANIQADCNMVTATYAANEADSTLTITPGASTLAACPPDSQATDFVNGLSAAAIYFFQDGHLFIDLFAGSGTMEFAPAEVAAAGETESADKGETTPVVGLAGQPWQLTLIAKRDGNVTVNDPTRYTVVFNADGTINWQADCNVGGASYTTGEGNALTITPGPSTMAFCGPGSLDQLFLGGLTNAMSYRVEGGNLIIDMLYESGSLNFAPAP